MRKLEILMVGILVMLISSCGGNKKLVQQQDSVFGQDVSMPCVDSSYDDDNYFRALGMGSNINPQNARTAAIDAAQSMFYKRLGGFVQGVASDYSRTMAGTTGENTQRAMEATMDKVVSQMVGDAQKTCEKMAQDNRGVFNAFISIQISKGELLSEMTNELSNNEELEIEFNRDQFRKYADEKMKKMKEAQREE